MIGSVRLVKKKNIGFRRVPVAQGGFEVGATGPGGVEASDPERAAGGLDADGFVDEGANA